MFWLATVFNGSISSDEMRRYEQWAREARADTFHGLLADAGRGLARGFAALGAGMRARHQRRRTIRQLRGLDDHLLADIGLTRDDLYLLNRGEWPTRLADAPAPRPVEGAGRRTRPEAAEQGRPPADDSRIADDFQQAA